MAHPVGPSWAESGQHARQSTVMGSWSGHGVGIGDVDDALLDLRRGERRAATRISTINLVVMAADRGAAERARLAMRRLGGRNPGRTVIIISDRQAAANVDAHVHLHHADVGARPVWWEEVLIMVSGPVCDHLDSLVEPLTLGDLPVTVWYTSRIPEPSEPLVAAADVVVVESVPGDEEARGSTAARREGDASEVLSRLLDLAQRRPLADLSWIRLTPWRRLLAALFDLGDYRDYATAVEMAEVAGRPGSALLLGGWLSERLHLPGSSVTRTTASDATIKLEATGGGGNGRFTVARDEGDDHLVATAEIDSGARHQEAVTLPADPLAATLTEALTVHGHDRVYESALAAAVDTPR